MPGVSLHPGGPARLGPHGAHLPLPTPPRRTRDRARDRGDRLQLDRAARAARRCLRATSSLRPREPRTPSRSRAGRRRCTSPSSSSGSGRATRSRARTSPSQRRANPIIYTGATPVFVDADAATWTIDPELLDRAISSRRAAGGRVRAVIAVDLYGQCCDYDAIREVCARHERRAPPGRRRVARGDVPRRARRRRRERSPRSRSTATRSSPRAAAGCSSRDDATGSSTRASSRPRRASRFRTTSTSRSASTTA